MDHCGTMIYLVCGKLDSCTVTASLSLVHAK